MEALTGALIGGIGFDYFFLPPRGFGIARPEHWVALSVFVFVAAAIGHLAARSKELLAQRDSLLRLSLDPLCVADVNGSLRSVNEAMVDLLGWPARELASRSLLELVHPDDRQRTQAALQGFFEAGAVVEIENRYRTKGGGWRWLHWKIAPPRPGASWFSAAARDITEEKWAREKLRDLAAQVMTAQEEERRRIAGELHDDVTQRPATIGIELGLLRKNPADEWIYQSNLAARELIHRLGCVRPFNLRKDYFPYMVQSAKLTIDSMTLYAQSGASLASIVEYNVSGSDPAYAKLASDLNTVGTFQVTFPADAQVLTTTQDQVFLVVLYQFSV